MSTSPKPNRSLLERVARIACIMTFALFVYNVLIGRFASVLGLNPTLRFDVVAEFLLLFITVVFFSIAALAAERREFSEPD